MVAGLVIYLMEIVYGGAMLMMPPPPNSATSASLNTAKPDLKVNGRQRGEPLAERELWSIPD